MLDPRVRRTRRRLKEALFELIREVGYRRLTVRALVARAGVARSTFYAHYDSKDALLFDGFDAWLLGLVEGDASSADARAFRFSLPLLRHAEGHRRIFRALFGRAGSPRAACRFRELLVEVVLEEMHAAASADPRHAEARAHAIAGAFLGLVTWWFEEGGRFSPEEADGIFQEVVGAGR